MDWLQINTRSKESIIESFRSIATDLILNKRIVINDYEYSFIDIEFYYWHKYHKDEYANGIKHLKPIGELEMHRYGVDISLGNTKDSYGGILIRGLWDLQKQNIIPKAHIVRILFNSFKQGINSFEIITQKSLWNGIFGTTRSKLGIPDNDAKKEFFNSKYRFLAKDERIFTKYPDKEDIFRNSDLTDNEIIQILQYSISR